MLLSSSDLLSVACDGAICASLCEIMSGNYLSSCGSLIWIVAVGGSLFPVPACRDFMVRCGHECDRDFSFSCSTKGTYAKYGKSRPFGTGNHVGLELKRAWILLLYCTVVYHWTVQYCTVQISKNSYQCSTNIFDTVHYKVPVQHSLHIGKYHAPVFASHT
jgi:hypothetical protein